MSPSDTAFPIIVVDDDVIATKIMAAIMTAAGHEVLVAQNGSEVLGLLKEGRSRMVVSDWSMPEMDGLQLCRAIRSRPERGYVYFIMVTAHGQRERLVEAFEAGVDDFISKPIEGQELLARVGAGMRILRLQGDLACANDRLERLAMTDELTGLPNRRYAVGRLIEEWALTERTGQRFACAMLDLDGFKHLNDTHGHFAGDAVLQQVSAVLRQSVRAGDVVARVGGDEFLIIFPQQRASSAALVAQRCREAVECLSVTHAGKVLNVTICVGVAEKLPDMQSPDELLIAADHALYTGKNAHGNTVRIVGDVQEQSTALDA